MKNMMKLGLVALIAASFAACDPAKKSSTPIDSASTTVKVDSTVKTTTGVDSAKNDTIKLDTTKM